MPSLSGKPFPIFCNREGMPVAKECPGKPSLGANLRNCKIIGEGLPRA